MELWLQALLLGIVQGVAEVFPVSSSAHLVILPDWLGWTYLGKSFDVALHGGTLIAFALFFRPQVDQLLRGLKGLLARERTVESERAAKVLVATLPVGAVGVVFNALIKEHLSGLGWITLMLVVGAYLLDRGDWRGTHHRDGWSLSWGEMALVGLAQAVALIPGTSRSGAVMACCLFLGVRRDESARLSVLLALPVLAGATLWEGVGQLGAPGPPTELMLMGAAAAAVSGWLSLRFLLGRVGQSGYRPFVLYRYALAIVLAGRALAGISVPT